jgi:hypothetical protein
LSYVSLVSPSIRDHLPLNSVKVFSIFLQPWNAIYRGFEPCEER